MRKQWLLIVLFTTCITILLSYTACTYDYFEDETNYIVYVPEVKEKTIDGCRVMIYDKSGSLVGDKSMLASTNDPKLSQGLFTFRLPAGDYKVYCYANLDSVSFADESSHEVSALKLLSNDTEEHYVQPSDVFFDIFNHTIQHPGVLTSDTTRIERYVGRITVRFKNFPFDLTDLNNVDLSAKGVATTQYLKDDTLTSHPATDVALRHKDDLNSLVISRGDEEIVEIDHRYFPSVEGEVKTLGFDFSDSKGELIARMPVNVVDPDTNIPIPLYHGQRIIIEVDKYLVTAIHLVGWDEDIQTGNDVGVW